MAQAARGFRVPPEVPRYFADRDLKPHFSWLDVWAEEHARAFTVAKAVELELLKAFHEGLKQAIDKGQSFETWRDELKPNLERLGWWGRRQVNDPTGQDKPRSVDFSAPRRLQTIFWSNMRSARAAGQWDRAQRTKKALPYLLYVRTTSKDPRREHLSWAGIILPIDHPFWRTHFPPNGWMCKCAVRQISAAERDRYGAMEGYSLEPPTIDMKPFVNRRTGEVTYVPVGIDPGWHTNPGLARSRWRAADEALKAAATPPKPTAAAAKTPTPADAAPPLLAIIAAQTIERAQIMALKSVVQARMASAEFETFYMQAVSLYRARKTVSAAVKATGGSLAEQNAAAAAAHPWTHRPFPCAVMPTRLDPWNTLPDRIVTVSDNGLSHSHDDHPTPIEDWQRLSDMLETGEVYLSQGNDRIWVLNTENSGGWVSVLAIREGAWRVITHFRTSERYMRSQRRKADRRLILKEGEMSSGGP